jgi:hypothetical protein
MYIWVEVVVVVGGQITVPQGRERGEVMNEHQTDKFIAEMFLLIQWKKSSKENPEHPASKDPEMILAFETAKQKWLSKKPKGFVCPEWIQ